MVWSMARRLKESTTEIMVKRLISVLYLVSRIFIGMGDHAATQENYALFDYLEYVPYDYSMKPIIEGQLTS